MSEDTKQCPFCGEEINVVAKKCKHCGEFLDEKARPAPAAVTAPAPGSDLNAAAKQKAIEDLSGIPVPTGKFILLTIATGGVYYFMHMFKLQTSLNDKIKNMVHPILLLIVAGMFAWGLIIDAWAFEMMADAQLLEDISASNTAFSITKFVKLVNYAYGIMIIVIAFQMKKALETYAAERLRQNVKLNPFATFFFNFFYINHILDKWSK